MTCPGSQMDEELNEAFGRYCLDRCECHDYTQKDKENVDPNVDAGARMVSLGTTPWTASGSGSRSRARPGSGSRSGSGSVTGSRNPTGARLHRRCNARTCWSPGSCGSGSGSCTCRAESVWSGGSSGSQSAASVGGTLFRGACKGQLLPRGLTADGEAVALGANGTASLSTSTTLPAIQAAPLQPCPCNCTYVSTACCSLYSSSPASGSASASAPHSSSYSSASSSSLDALASEPRYVYEPSSRRLGQLQPPAGMCCNMTSGALQELDGLGHESPPTTVAATAAGDRSVGSALIC